MCRYDNVVDLVVAQEGARLAKFCPNKQAKGGAYYAGPGTKY